MATRTTSLESKIMDALKEWESSKETPATLQEVMGEFGTTDKETYDALGALEDAGKVSSEGRWLTSVWFLGSSETPETVKEETPKPKRKRRTKAEMAAAREEAANRTRYAANVAESQDMDAQHATPRVVTPSVVPAETPVIAQDGSTVTVPVDYDDESKGRRELDASQGERVIAEDDMRAMILELRRENAALKAKRESETQEETATLVFHEPKNGPCPGNEIPPVPAGVPRTRGNLRTMRTQRARGTTTSGRFRHSWTSTRKPQSRKSTWRKSSLTRMTLRLSSGS